MKCVEHVVHYRHVMAKEEKMSKIKILIVEDEQLMALDLQEKLEKMGFIVTGIADSGDQAIAKVKETRPDLVLMDIVIEGNFDGIETADKVRRDFNIPVVYLTAFTDEETMHRAKLSEPFAYLVKPYNEWELKFIIEMATSKHKLEMDLIKSEERYRSLQENIPLGVFRTTPEGKIISGNPALADMFGFDNVEEMLGVSAPDLYFDPEHRQDLMDMLKEKGVVTGFEVQLNYRDGSIFWGSENISAVKGKGGKVIYLDGIVEDISERKKMEEEMQKTEKLESLGLLAGGIAHDFNNILAAILVNISLARMYAEKDEKAVERLRDAEKAVSRAQNLTQQLLTFSMGGAPIKSLSSIEELLRDTAEFALSGSNVKCEFNLQPNLWDARLDRGQVSQVMQNLIMNAEQAMPEGGAISIKAENEVLEEDEIPPLKEGKYIKIFIADNGIGIPADHLDKIFDPFFTTKQKGSGLGLSTAYSIIKNHSGLLTVESTLGKGTVFCVYLPSSRERTVKSEKSGYDTTSTVTGRILLMDDEEMILEGTGRLLRKFGYTVVTVYDGEAALDTYKEAGRSGRPFDAVILDLIVPGGMGGKETIQELQKIDPNVKAVVSSGYSTDAIMANHEEYGFAAAVSKPYKARELGRVLKQILGKGKKK